MINWGGAGLCVCLGIKMLWLLIRDAVFIYFRYLFRLVPICQHPAFKNILQGKSTALASKRKKSRGKKEKNSSFSSHGLCILCSFHLQDPFELTSELFLQHWKE